SGRVSRRSHAGPMSPGNRRAMKAATVMTKNRGGAESQLTVFLIASIIASDRAGDAAVLADAPEVDRHQNHRHDRDPDTVQDIEAQERAGAHEASAEQREARVVAGVHQADIADLEKTGARAFVPEEGSGARHVRADGDGPHGQP